MDKKRELYIRADELQQLTNKLVVAYKKNPDLETIEVLELITDHLKGRAVHLEAELQKLGITIK